MNYAELVLLFDTDKLTDVEGQLGKAFDNFSVAGNFTHTPTMMIVRKAVWVQLEKELQMHHKDRYISGDDILKGLNPETQERLKRYDVAVSKGTGVARPENAPQGGYNAIIFRARPVVAIDGPNIVADRVGAND